MSRIALILLIGTALVIAVSACGIALEDDGPYTRTHRPVEPFHRLTVDGSTTVVVRPGRAGTLSLAGGRNRVADVITRVEDGTLIVETRDSSGTIDLGTGHVTIVAHSPRLSAVRLAGSGEIDLPNLRGRHLAVAISGSGEVRGGGRLSRLDADLDGSGNLDLDQVDIEQRLDIEISGSGDVTYGGDPVLRKSVSGSGDVDHD
jgi:hypothetical protein